MPTSEQWKRAVVLAVKRHPKAYRSIVNALARRYPKHDRKTLQAKVSEFALRNPDTGRYEIRITPRPRRPPTGPRALSGARRFYAELLRIGSAEPHHAWFHRQLGGRPYTEHMKALFAEVGRAMGYTVPPGPELALRDQVWIDPTGEYRVVIEHENNDWEIEGLKREFDHLVLSEADLRILVAYPPAASLDRATKGMVDEAIRRLSTRSRTASEFLILTAPDDLSDVREFHANLVSLQWTDRRI